jgi:hypothetical protein
MKSERLDRRAARLFLPKIPKINRMHPVITAFWNGAFHRTL